MFIINPFFFLIFNLNFFGTLFDARTKKTNHADLQDGLGSDKDGAMHVNRYRSKATDKGGGASHKESSVYASANRTLF
jgi:hypothetical protein